MLAEVLILLALQTREEFRVSTREAKAGMMVVVEAIEPPGNPDSRVSRFFPAGRKGAQKMPAKNPFPRLFGFGSARKREKEDSPIGEGKKRKLVMTLGEKTVAEWGHFL